MKELKVRDLKQKNKPFKGTNKKKLKHKAVPKIEEISKPISKQTDKKLVSKQLDKKQGKKKKGQPKKQEHQIPFENIDNNLYLSALEKAKILSLQETNLIPKIIALIPMNDGANAELLKSDLQEMFKESGEQKSSLKESGLQFSFPYLKFWTDPKKFGELKKENYIFISCDRDLSTCLDYCKVADIIVPILSCEKCNVEGINLDPLAQANAFDEKAYDLLKALRIQGMPSVLALIQGIDTFSGPIKQKVKHLFSRFIASEFSENEKCIFIEKDQSTYLQFIRFLQGIQFQKLKWRDQRGYMLADTVLYNQNENQIELFGYLKGKSINPNQLVHITGYGDFQIKRIDILKNPLKTQHKKQKKNIEIEDQEITDDIILSHEYDPLKIESLECMHAETQDLSYLLKQSEAKQKEEQKIMDLEEQKQEAQNDNEIESDYDDGSDIEYQEQKNENWDKEQMMEEKKKIKFELRQRNHEDYEFDEEAEYQSDLILKDRFAKYCGLKNFKADWNIFKNLPEKQFGKIFIYENFIRAQKESRQNYLHNGFAFQGFYIRVVLQNAQLLANHTPNLPLILSTLFEHERKVTIVNFKIQLALDYQDLVLKSKQPQSIQVGFRRDIVKPIYSEIYQNCAKTKYKKEIKGKSFYMASFYYYTLFTPATIILFTPKNNLFPNDKIAFASGELHSVNPLHVILKKKILTGYPQRIQKKKAVVKLMFFNKIDVDYFSPIQLNTKLGLKGKIKESVGTHGIFKSAFNQFIKSHDTICLALYKRVYPPWVLS